MELAKKSYPAMDIAKFIMAILVVAIHVRPFTGNVAFFYDDCIARIADPLFFMISAYLLFAKVFREDDSKEPFKKYMLRMIKLYFIWVLIYSPVIIHHTIIANKEAGSIEIIFLLVRKIFLEGPYGAMWFMTALLLAMPLTYVISKYVGPIWTVMISFPFFLFTVMEMEYTRWFGDIDIFRNINHLFEGIFGWLANGLTYGFFFCACGMYIAYKGQRKETMAFHAIGGGISLILLVVECICIREYNLGVSYGAMLCLIPVSLFLLQLFIDIQMKERRIYHRLRKYSVLIFTIHYGIMELFQFLLRNVTWYMQSTTVQYIIVLTITIGLAIVIVRLSEIEKFRKLQILY